MTIVVNGWLLLKVNSIFSMGKSNGKSANHSNGRYLKRRREEDYEDVPEHNRQAELRRRNSKEYAHYACA